MQFSSTRKWTHINCYKKTQKPSLYKLPTVHVESPESSEATCMPFSRGLTLVSGTFKITSVAALEALSLPVPTCTHCKQKASVTLRLLSYILTSRQGCINVTQKKNMKITKMQYTASASLQWNDLTETHVTVISHQHKPRLFPSSTSKSLQDLEQILQYLEFFWIPAF